MTENKIVQGHQITDLYAADWRVEYKCNMLMKLAEKIDQGTSDEEDHILSIDITYQVENLIVKSEYIPDECKAELIRDMYDIRKMFIAAIEARN